MNHMMKMKSRIRNVLKNTRGLYVVWHDMMKMKSMIRNVFKNTRGLYVYETYDEDEE